MLDPVVVVACCAGLGLTLSFLTLGSSRPPHHAHQRRPGNRDEKEEGRPGGGGEGGGGEGNEEGHSSRYPHSSSGSGRRRVMVITAHPDDEVMFFGPTILHFTRQEGALVYLLCMSTGNYYGQGKVRTRELLASCRLLGLESDNVIQYRCDDLPDHPDVLWPTVHTANLINHHIHALDVDMVVTFDMGGVSGHSNHSALFFALQHLVEREVLPPRCEAYSLDTVGMVRKYSSLLDVPISYSLSSCAFTVDRKHHTILQRAMRAHSSQYVWFRRLYMYFSRYVLINTLSRITP